MKSGLEGRNNAPVQQRQANRSSCLNEVRPRRPEQSPHPAVIDLVDSFVSMKSGLEGRNNWAASIAEASDSSVSMKSGLEGRNNTLTWNSGNSITTCLNEVRPRRPEQ